MSQRISSETKREYSSQADYAAWVRDSIDKRAAQVTAALRKAFKDTIRKEEAEVIVFSGMSAKELSDRIVATPIVLKPLLLATNIAARAIERDLGIKNLDPYASRMSQDEALTIAGYIKPFLPDSLPLPTLAKLDSVMFADKEIRKIKGQWERQVNQALNTFASVSFKKSKFRDKGQAFELDATATNQQGQIQFAVDIKRIEARRDIHKRTDEIVNKAAHLKASHPAAHFGTVIYYPFVTEHANVRDRLQSPHIDSVVFAGSTTASICTAVKLLLGKFGCLKP